MISQHKQSSVVALTWITLLMWLTLPGCGWFFDKMMYQPPKPLPAEFSGQWIGRLVSVDVEDEDRKKYRVLGLRIENANVVDNTTQGRRFREYRADQLLMFGGTNAEHRGARLTSEKDIGRRVEIHGSAFLAGSVSLPVPGGWRTLHRPSASPDNHGQSALELIISVDSMKPLEEN